MNSNPNKNELNFSEGNNAIFISHPDMHYHKYITAEEIDEINKLVGVDNFIGYSKEAGGYGGGCENAIATILIPIAVGVFSSATYDLLKLAVVELVKTMKKHFLKEKEKTYIFDFQIKDDDKGFSFDLTINANATTKDIEGILDKAKAIVEIVKK